MHLSANLISYHLKKEYQGLQSSDWLSCEPLLKYVVRYDGNMLAENGIIYLIDDPALPLPNQRLSKNMAIFAGDCANISEQNYPNYCFLPADTDMGKLLLFLQEVFERYRQWDQHLVDSLLSHASVQELVDLTEDIISNPMMVISMNFTIIASRDLPFVGELKNAVLGSTEATQPLVNALKQDINYEEAYNRTGYFYYPGNHIATPKLCANIRKSTKTIYRLMVYEGEIPLDDTFGFLLEHLAKMISHALTANTGQDSDTAYTINKIFLELLTTPSADYVEISRQFSTLGWLSSHYYQCVLIRLALHDMKNLTVHSICNYVENAVPSSCALNYQGNALVFINLTLCPLSQGELFRKLSDFVHTSRLLAGCSRKMLGHFNFYRQYLQASATLQAGERQNPTNRFHYFDDIALYYIFEQTTKKLPAYMICHEKLLDLKNEDETNQTQLYRTLRCFLENCQGITRTAEDLFIHRSTLLYRLEKIKKILGTDFSDPQEFLYFFLSFYLLDMEEQR